MLGCVAQTIRCVVRGEFWIANKFQDRIGQRPTVTWFNEQTVMAMLNNLESLGPAIRVAGTESGGVVVMPTLKVKDFNFTSLSDAV